MAEKQNTSLATINNQPAALVVQETASQAMAAQSKALVEARYIMALKQPRDFDSVREKFLRECRRPSFAAVARYRKPVGKGIEGPSIRFAEAAIRCMTNVVVTTTTVFDDDNRRIVHVEVADLEANAVYGQDITINKTVERRKTQQGDTVLSQRKNSHGDTVYILAATDDDILNKQNALISKAIRTQGLRLIPGDLIDEAEDVIKETLAKQDSADPDAAKRKLFDAFGAQGVRVEQIKEYLGHDGQTLSPKELGDLRGLYAALRDGETTWREIMDAKTPGDAKSNDLKSALANATQNAAPAEVVDEQTGEVTTQTPAAPDAKPAEQKFTIRGKKADRSYDAIVELAGKVGSEGLAKACSNLGIEQGVVTRDYPKLDAVRAELEKIAGAQP